MPTNRVALQIDAKPLIDVGSGNVGESADSFAPPARTSAPAAPDNLQLSTGLSQADRSALAWIDATWDDPPSEVQSYSVQCATDTAFTQNVYVRDARSASIRIDGRKPGTLYYVRVRANYRDESSEWSAASSITTKQDETPPSQPSDTVLSFATNADLVLIGTNPPEENFAQLEIIIRGSAVGPIYAVIPLSGKPGAAFRFVWPAAENVRLASGDGSLTVEVRAQNFVGFASAPVVLSATKNPPATPIVTTTWDARAGAVTFTWSSVSFGTYTLSIDGVPRQVQSPYVYDVALNRKEHSGNASGSLAWSMVAADPLGQTSTTASGTALLPRPDTPTSVVPVWDSFAGTWSISFALVATAIEYNLVIDGKGHKFFNDRFSYLVGTNRSEHGGNASASLVWSLVAIDGLGQTSATPASGTSTLAPPATPTATTDFASATAAWAWNLNTSVPEYVLTIDGKPRTVKGTSYSYDFAANAKEHSGTATPSLPWSLVAVDGLGQTSAATSGTLANAAPDAPTAIGLVAGATGFVVSITHPTTLDLRDYTVRIIKNGSTLETLTRTVSGFNYIASASATYTVGVIVNDVFGQSSSEYVTPVGTTTDVLSMDELRADAIYRDSLGTAASTLAALKDDNRLTNVVIYPVSVWNWTEARRASSSRVGNIVIAATAAKGYVGISEDGVTYSWFSGPLASDGQTLTAVASEAAAQTAAIDLPSNGTWSLPTTASARYIKLGHRDTVSGYVLREFYPPTLIVADNIRVGLLRGFKVVANQLVVDELSAIVSFLGTVQISGWASIGSAGGIWQGSSGTPTSPNTGFKLYLSGTGKGLWETWLGGVKQVYLDDATMGLLFGAGRGRLDANGMAIFGDDTSGSSYVPSLAIRWLNPSSGEDRLRMFTNTWSTQTLFYQQALPATGQTQSAIFLEAHRSRIGDVRATVEVSTSRIQLLWSGSSVRAITLDDSGANLPVTTAVGLTAGALTSTGPISAASATISGALSAASASLSGALTAGANSTINTAVLGVHPNLLGGAALWMNGNTNPAFWADGTNTRVIANSTSGNIYFFSGTNQRASLNASGHLYISGVLYPSNQNTHFLGYRSDAPYQGGYSSGFFTAQSGLISGDDIYWGRNSIWLSAWLNQSLVDTASPTFQAMTVRNTLTVNSADGTSGYFGSVIFGPGSGERIGSDRSGGTNQFGVTIYTNATARTHWSNAGNVGIATLPGTSTRLLINSGGNTNAWSGLQVRNSDNSIDFQVFSNGACTYRTSMTMSSDRRLKRDIRPLSDLDDMLARFDQIELVDFTRPGLDRRQRGVVAQELRELFPELVYGRPGGYLSVDYIGLIPLAIAKIRQLEQRLVALESR